MATVPCADCGEPIEVDEYALKRGAPVVHGGSVCVSNLRALLARYEDDARKWYRADGTVEMLPPAEVIGRRKAAARALSGLVTCGAWRHGAEEKLPHPQTPQCFKPVPAFAPVEVTVTGNVLTKPPARTLRAGDTLTLQFGDGRVVRLVLRPRYQIQIDTSKTGPDDLPPLPEDKAEVV